MTNDLGAPRALEFDEIAGLFLPLTRGAPEALGLLDDAAVIASRPGQDLVVTKDAVVAGVHALADATPAQLAQRLLRVNLSDLAAKGATPWAAFLAVAWPEGWGGDARTAFARALGEDMAAFDISLLGGDTVRTPGPFTASLTLIGWVPAGGMVRRSGARPGQALLVSGTIGDGALGLEAARGEGGFPDEDRAYLARRFHLPTPRLALTAALRAEASAAADVSDGLLADAAHIARASGVTLTLELETVPLSAPAQRWLERQPDPLAALLHLVSGGDDYEIVVAADASAADGLMAAGAACGAPLVRIGQAVVRAEGAPDLTATLRGVPVALERLGWTHL